MSSLDPKLTAKRLGLTDNVIRQLQASGLLHRLALSDAELDERLYRAQLAQRARRSLRPRR
jgi:hypothetical protein